MLRVQIPKQELFNDETGEFSYNEEFELVLEHSLISLSKWESKWEKPFLTDDHKTDEETLDYIRCMTISRNVKLEDYTRLDRKHFDAINKYIEAPMTATTFTDKSQTKTNKQIITSELIYFWMVSLNIPFECQKWHLNRLLTLVNVVNVKNQPEKKMSRKATHAQYRSLNEKRKAEANTKG